MGFFKFLKAKKKEDFAPPKMEKKGLDIPPPPPGFGPEPKSDAGEGHALDFSFPPREGTPAKKRGEYSLPEPTELGESKVPIPPMGFNDVGGLKIPKEIPKPSMPPTMPVKKEEDDELSKIEGEMKKEAEKEPGIPPAPSFPEHIITPAKKEVHEELPLIEEAPLPPKVMLPKQESGDIFLGISQYQGVIGNLSRIQGNLKGINAAFVNMNKCESKKNDELHRWHSVVEDIQRKLIFTDKSLFER